MDMSDIIQTMKISLGYPKVTVNVGDEQLELIVKKAIRKCADKASPNFTMTGYVSGGKVSMKGTNVAAVRNIYAGLNNGDATTQDIFNLGVYTMNTESILNYANQIGQIAEYRRLMLYDFYLDGEDLYVDNYSGEVTIEYVKKTLELEDLPPDWLSWVEDYSTAIAKIAEGRIRGKYKPSNAPFETNADELVSEGQTEKSDCEMHLDSAMGYWNIIR